MIQVSVDRPKLQLSRGDSWSRPLLVTRRRREPPYRLIAAVALPLAALAVLALVARRRFFQGAGVVADAVEGAADALEDAAEDLAEAARERAARAD